MLNKKILLLGFVASVIAIFGYRTWHTTQNHPTTLVVTPTLPSTTILTGYWFTPHAAIRNITILDHDQFEFKTGDATTSIHGTYVFDGTTVTLPLDNQGQTVSLKLSHDNIGNAYLTNEKAGEYFVKQ